jgi:hypothetical protein
MKNKLVLTGVVALIVGLGIGYFGATTFTAAPAKTVSGFTRGAGGGFAGARGGTTGGGFLTGTVASVGSGSITLNTNDGSSHVVLVTPQTSISKSVEGSLTDIVVGSTVIVSGTTNSDGSVSAALVQIRPAGSLPVPTSTPPTSTTGQ